MSLYRIKLIHLFVLLTVLLPACGVVTSPIIDTGVNTSSVPDSVVEDISPQEEYIAEEAAPAEQPLFAAEIYRAIEACSGLSLNQVCLGGGSGSDGLATGQIADLSAGQSFRLASTSLDDYTVLIIRLQAPGVDSDFNSLLVLAAGTIEVTFNEIFYGRDETNLNQPRIRFSSTDGVDFSSGLVIINESDEDLLSLEVNGVGLTLGSTAIITSQPNSEMRVGMKTGTVAVSANEETVHAAKGESITVAMTAESRPASVPQQPGVEDELLTPLVPPVSKSADDDFVAIKFARENYHKFESAYNRCMSGDARQVYRLMYFAQLLLNNQNASHAEDILFILTPARVSEMKEKVRKCATFELILTGRQQGSSSLSWSTAVAGDVLQLQFDDQGKLVTPVEGELKVTEFFPDMPLPPGCTSTTETGNSLLRVKESSTLKIYYNTMQIRMYFWPNPVTETLVMNCPSAPPVKIPLDWNTYFWYLHPDLLRQDNQSYLVQDWEYTGGEIYAEAFYLGRSGTIEDGVVTSDTAFTLLHTPQK